MAQNISDKEEFNNNTYHVRVDHYSVDQCDGITNRTNRPSKMKKKSDNCNSCPWSSDRQELRETERVYWREP